MFDRSDSRLICTSLEGTTVRCSPESGEEIEDIGVNEEQRAHTCLLDRQMDQTLL